jgi:hypothetical protein
LLAWLPLLLLAWHQVVRVEPSSSQLSCSSSAPASVLPEPEGIADAPEWAKPNRSWVQQFVADFQQLRLEVQHAYEQRGEAKSPGGGGSLASLKGEARV